MLPLLDITIVTVGSENTFNREGCVSVIDITMASSVLASRRTWTINNVYAHRDYLAIIFQFQENNRAMHEERPCRSPKFKTESLDTELFLHMLEEAEHTKLLKTFVTEVMR